MPDFNVLLGKAISSIDGDKVNELIFNCTDKTSFKLYHDQDCCESVTIEDIAGDLNDLLNSPIVLAEENSNHEEKNYDSITWTFYRIATQKGLVVIRWYGESNGYYSESVDFVQLASSDAAGIES